MSKPRFQLLIEAQHQADDPEGNRRLRMALKSMLQRHGLKCITVTSAPEDRSTNSKEAKS